MRNRRASEHRARSKCPRPAVCANCAPVDERLDLPVDRNFQIRGGSLDVYARVQNTFDRGNYFAEMWNLRANKPKTDHQLGVFPVFVCEWRSRWAEFVAALIRFGCGFVPFSRLSIFSKGGLG